MTGPSSQNTATRPAGSLPGRRRRAAPTVLACALFAAALGMAVDYIPESRMGRVLSAHLALLADPVSWTR